MKPIQFTAIKLAGEAAFHAGHTIMHCPYMTGTPEFAAWKEGYVLAMFREDDDYDYLCRVYVEGGA